MTNEAGLAAGPLQGLRILDLSTYVAGPSCTMTLGQLGAEVIRVDPVGGAADTRRLPLAPSGTSLYWAGLNNAKQSIEINTATVEGRELVGALLAATGPPGGIMLTNAVQQPWLSYEAMRRYREDLIAIHIMGRRDGTPAVDYTVNSEIGLPLITGPGGFEGPVNHVLPAWDLLTGLHAAIAILAADRVRRQSGAGQLISVALADVAVATMSHLGFIADVIVNGSDRLREGNYLYGSFGCDFQTSDGERVMIVALTARHWHKLVGLVDLADVISALERSLGVDLDFEDTRYRHREVLEALIRPWFGQRTIDEVERALDDAQILWGRYRTVKDLVRDPSSLLNATDLMTDVAYPGLGTIPVPGPVLKFSRSTPPAPRATCFGQDTARVLTDLLGLSESTLRDLGARGIIGQGTA